MGVWFGFLKVNIFGVELQIVRTLNKQDLEIRQSESQKTNLDSVYPCQHEKQQSQAAFMLSCDN